MKRFGKRYAPLIVIAAALLAALAWSWQSLDASAASAAAAAADLATCQRLAGRVAALSKNDREASAAATQLGTPDVARLIESAATTAAMPRGSLIRIAPEPPRAREGRPYPEQSTEVVFQAVTVEQTVRFFYALSTAAPNLRLTNLRLLAPAEGAQRGATWNAEIRLTRLIYTPAAPQKLTGLQP